MIVVFGKGKVGNTTSKLLKYLGKEYFLIDDKDRDDEKLTQAEKIMVTPGLPQHHKLYKKYYEKVIGELDLIKLLYKEFLGTDKQFPKIETIGITGTNGKSTTCWITYNVFKGLFEQQDIMKSVYLSGNFGTPLSELILELLQQGKTDALVVLELSSFMLYNCHNFTFDYSILTNIATDHLDWHKNFDEYTYCKQQVIRQTTKNAYTTSQVYTELEEKLQNKTEIFDSIFDLGETQFLGQHNQYNFKSSDRLVRQYYLDHNLKFPEERYISIIKNIVPLDHRMKLVKTLDNKGIKIKIYDDGICTSAHALTGALSCIDSSSLSGEDRGISKIVLIAGGYDKGEAYEHLAPVLKKKVAFLSLLGDTGKNKFLPIAEQENIKYKYSKTLKQAIYSAVEYAKQNAISIILFSPGSASFDMFKNVYDRCDQFEKIIEKL